MSIIETAARTLVEQRGADPTLPWGSSYIPTNGQLGFIAAGVPMNDDAALSLSTVASCIRMRADAISSLPLVGLKKTKDRSKKILDPQPLLLTDPWPEGTAQDWVTQIMVSLDLRGNFFGRVVDRDTRGYPTTVMPVHPDEVFAWRDRKTGKRIYRFRGEVIPRDDVVHIPSTLQLPGGFIGLNPVEYMRSSWGLAAAAEKYGGQFFANSANPSGILSTEQDLSEDETLEWARQWRAAHGGLGNAHLPAILTGGANWQQISIAPEDAQFLQTRTFQREQIISWFGIPPHKVGIMDKTSGPTDAEGLEMVFVQDALVPPASRIEAYLFRLLPPSQLAKFDFSARLRGNTLQRMQAWQIAANTGIEMIDELRAMEDKEPLPNGMGQVILRPLNMAAYDASTGEPILHPQQDPTMKPANPGGFGDGGGDPNNSPAMTAPDAS